MSGEWSSATPLNEVGASVWHNPSIATQGSPMIALRSSICRAVLCSAVLFAFGPSLARAEEPVAESEHQPGRGWQIPGTGLSIGGYASGGFVDYQHDASAFVIDNLSLIAHWESEGKWRVFSELDLEDVFAYQPGRGRLSSRSYLALERLYADYLYSTALNLRLGKFLTPIGRWNIIHADPLVWTTSRPLVTEQTFPTNATGIMLFGSAPLLGKTLDYSVYGAVGNDWRPDPELDPFEEAYGVHASMPVSANAEFGISLVSFEQRDTEGERRKLIGFDYNWSRERFEISAEAAYRFSDRGDTFDERGMFVQAVAPLTQKLYAVGRYEYFDAAGPTDDTHLWLAGVAYKIAPAFVLKAEYRESSRYEPRAPSGVLTSISVLF
jgi:hypothetical protein